MAGAGRIGGNVARQLVAVASNAPPDAIAAMGPLRIRGDDAVAVATVRDGAVHGEECRPAEAEAAVAALRAGRAIPVAPSYG